MISRLKTFGIATVLTIATAASIPALPPTGEKKAPNFAALSLDNTNYIDVNNTLAFVTNYGALFRDLSNVFGYDYGYFCPYMGTEHILDGTYAKSPVYAAGLWLGGQVGGQNRIAVAEYSSEFVPGLMQGGTFTPDQPSYRIYKLYRDSLETNPNDDYTNWPIAQGAPADQSGKPILLGDEMLWSVYNDADPDAHSNDAGSTLPLGVEVQQTVWGTKSGTSEDNSLYVRYKLYNKSGYTINNFYISFWADPDIGGGGDDLVGCDTLKQTFFVYNATNNDAVYGVHPPAWGARLLAGPVVPSPGDTAWFDGHIRLGYKNLPMTAFDKYINGTDPTNYNEVFNYMQGLYQDGSPMLDGHLMCTGDPITGTGILDYGPADRRLLMSCGPVTFLAGDSQQMVLKFATGLGSDRLSSLAILRYELDSTVQSAPCDNAVVSTTHFGHLGDIRFEPAEEQWIDGFPFGNIFYNGGAGYGSSFFGSSLNPDASPGSFPRVAIRFSRHIRQYAYRYNRTSFNYDGYVSVPFTVWDLDYNQQLAAAIVEDSNSRTFDGTWNIDDSAHYGGREYIMVFSTPYSLDPLGGPVAYTQKNLSSDGPTLPILYGVWPMLKSGHTMNELDEGQRILFDVQSANLNGPHSRIDFGNVRIGSHTAVQASVTCSASGGFPAFTVAVSDSSIFSVSDDTEKTVVPPVRGIIAVREIASPQGPVDPPDGRDVFFISNSTNDWMVTAPYNSLDALNQTVLPQTDWEVRFTTSGSICYDYYTHERKQARVPFELWNIGDGSLNETGDDRRITVLLLDSDEDGMWDYGDRCYALEESYLDDGPQTLDVNFDNLSLRRIMFADISHVFPAPPPGTIVRYISARGYPASKPPTQTTESDFVAQSPFGVIALDPEGESGRNIKITFSPNTAGTSTGYLQVVDSIDGLTVSQFLLSGNTEVSCCQGTTGNVNGVGIVDLADLTTLVLFLTDGQLPSSFPCPEEANINGREIIDLADLSLLVRYLTSISGDIHLPNCPASAGL